MPALPKFEFCPGCVFFFTEPAVCLTCKSGEQFEPDELDHEGLEELRGMQDDIE